MKRYHVRSVFMSYYYCPDARLCAPLFDTNIGHTHTHPYFPSLVRRGLLRAPTSMHVTMCHCASVSPITSCRWVLFGGFGPISVAVCAQHPAIVAHSHGIAYICASCMRSSLALKQKPSFDMNLELINMNPRTTPSIESDFQTHRTILLLLLFSFFSRPSFPYFLPIFPLLLNWFVRISLTGLACRQTYHIDMCPESGVYFDVAFFPHIFLSLVFASASVPGCRGARVLFAIVYFAIKWARPVLGIYISRQMLRGNILLLYFSVARRTNVGAVDAIAANHHWPHTANAQPTNKQINRRTHTPNTTVRK